MSLEFHDIVVSAWRWLCGLSFGAISGLALALLVRPSQITRDYSVHLASFFRALPILALVPVVSKFIGIGEVAKVLLISWACFFPVFISTVRASSDRIVDLELRIDAVGLGKVARFRHYELPRTLFGFLAGVEISVGIGWLTVVAAEFLGTFATGPFRGGLGDAVFVSFNNNNYSTGFLCLALFGILGVMSSIAWRGLSLVVVRAAGFSSQSSGW